MPRFDSASPPAYRPALMRLRPLASSLGAALLLSFGSLGCGDRSQSSAPKDASAPGDASPAAAPTAEGSAKSAPAEGATKPNSAPTSAADEARPVAAKIVIPGEGATAPDQPGGAAAPLPEGESRADRFADLETLCAALVRDYVDGTLTDYYHDLTMKTEFGGDLRRRGEDSMKPGRILEAGQKKLGERPGDPATPSCEQLFDELDDLE